MDSSDFSDEASGEINVEERVRNIRSSLLPSKSEKKYNKTVYANFLSWQKLHSLENFNEETLLIYFDELHNRNKLNAATLWSYYSMLKTLIAQSENVDISKYCSLIAYLKKQNANYVPKKAPVFTVEEIETFLKAPDSQWLVVKVAFVFGLYGAMRCDELQKVRTNDIRKEGSVIMVEIVDTKTGVPRRFVIDKLELVDLVEKYQRLRPPAIKSDRFFLMYRNGRCINQVMGKNMFYRIPRQIAEYLNLKNPERYTGHAIRRTSASTIANAGADIRTIQKLGGWKSAKIAEDYVESSTLFKKKTARFLNDAINVRSNEPDYINSQPSTYASSSVTTPQQEYTPINVNPNDEYTTVLNQSSVASSSVPAMESTKRSESSDHKIVTDDINIDDYIIEEFSQPFEPSSTVPVTVGNRTFNFTNCSNFSITINK